MVGMIIQRSPQFKYYISFELKVFELTVSPEKNIDGKSDQTGRVSGTGNYYWMINSIIADHPF